VLDPLAAFGRLFFYPFTGGAVAGSSIIRWYAVTGHAKAEGTCWTTLVESSAGVPLFHFPLTVGANTTPTPIKYTITKRAIIIRIAVSAAK
jgi:hypothetical protein